MRRHLQLAGVVLMPLAARGPSTGGVLMIAAAAAAVLLVVLVVAAVALGAAFARSRERRQACLRTLQTLFGYGSSARRR